MSKTSLQEQNPERYASIRRMQDDMKEEYNKYLSVARRCPYCHQITDVIYKGDHGPTSVKCSNCKEMVYFPPISFRTA